MAKLKAAHWAWEKAAQSPVLRRGHPWQLRLVHSMQHAADRFELLDARAAQRDEQAGLLRLVREAMVVSEAATTLCGATPEFTSNLEALKRKLENETFELMVCGVYSRVKG